MLKYLPLAATIAVTNLAVIATNTTFTAPAAAVAVESNYKLIAKDEDEPNTNINKAGQAEKLGHINANQQSDVTAIRQTLTQFYRGMNKLDVDRMAQAWTGIPLGEKEGARSLFKRLKSEGIDLNIEVQNIELTALSAKNASVNISSRIQGIKNKKRMPSYEYSTSFALTKEGSQWKISYNKTLLQSLNRQP